MKEKKLQYIIGIDGGGTKTIAVLANLRGKVLAKAETGSSNPLKVGMKIAVLNIRKATGKILKKYQKEKIAIIYLALAAGIEKDKKKKTIIKKNLLKYPEFNRFSDKKIIIEGDQLAAFRSGTDKKAGVVLISGTGSVAMGWKKGKEAMACGWDWFLGDDGSGFWLGRRALRMVCRQLDGRGEETKLTDLVFKKWKIRRKEELMKRVYFDYKKDFVEQISLLSPLIDKAAKKGDKIAKDILIEGGQELVLAASQVIKKLNFEKENFPLVLVGSTLKSSVVLNKIKKEVRKIAPKVELIRPKQIPAIGAIKLALEFLENADNKD